MLDKATQWNVLIDRVLHELKGKGKTVMKQKGRGKTMLSGPMGPSPRTDNYNISSMFHEHPKFSSGSPDYYAMRDATHGARGAQAGAPSQSANLPPGGMKHGVALGFTSGQSQATATNAMDLFKQKILGGAIS